MDHGDPKPPTRHTLSKLSRKPSSPTTAKVRPETRETRLERGIPRPKR